LIDLDEFLGVIAVPALGGLAGLSSLFFPFGSGTGLLAGSG
jgi:hypothetical protein